MMCFTGTDSALIVWQIFFFLSFGEGYLGEFINILFGRIAPYAFGEGCGGGGLCAIQIHEVAPPPRNV